MSHRKTLGPLGRVKPSEQVASRQFDDEWILLDLEGGNYFALDELGGAVWGQLREGRSPQEISESLAKSYDVEHGVLLRDIVTFVDDLVERELVKPLEGETRGA